jgi:hypothetical protein
MTLGIGFIAHTSCRGRFTILRLNRHLGESFFRSDRFSFGSYATSLATAASYFPKSSSHRRISSGGGVPCMGVFAHRRHDPACSVTSATPSEERWRHSKAEPLRSFQGGRKPF